MGMLALKVVVGFVIVVAMFRVMGKKTLKQSTPLDMLFVIIIGDFYTGIASDQDATLLDLAFILGLSFTLIYVLEMLSKKKKISALIEGEPREIIRNGRLKCDVLEREKMTVEDVTNELRTQGIFNIKEVELGILELSGKISVKKGG